MQEFRLTLEPGRKLEAIGPFYFNREAGDQKSFGVPPLFTWTTDSGVDATEFDILYPLLTVDRFGAEYRWQLFQLFNISGGATQDENAKDRFTIFPFYFQQRSADTNLNYTALFPFYGTLKNRVLRDEISFLMYPLYIRTHRRDFITDNYFYPFFHLRHGDGVTGWQFWPLVGAEHKAVTLRTNNFEETYIVPGYEKFFALWPFWFNEATGLGTDNPTDAWGVMPFYSQERSPQRDSTTVLWPFFNYVDDRTLKFRQWNFPWPLVVFARPTGKGVEGPPTVRRWPITAFIGGEGKTINRVIPFFNIGFTETLRTESYLWPLYINKRVYSEPLDRERVRIFWFLYSDLTERNTVTGRALHRVDFWPFFTYRMDLEGRERLQILSPLEPILTGNKSIERNYSPLWSLWRSEKNSTTGASSQSLLWNLYRSDITAESKKCSLLFGLFQYKSNLDGRRWRLFYIPFGQSSKPTDANPKP